MKAYSQDLREHVLKAVDHGYPRAEIVQMFSVSLSTIKRYIKQRRDEGHVQPKAIPGRPPKKRAQVAEGVLPQLLAHDDATLEQHSPNSKPRGSEQEPEHAKPWKRPLLRHYSLSPLRMRRDGSSIAVTCSHAKGRAKYGSIFEHTAVTATHKKILVARLGNDFTLKRLLMEKTDIVLKPENPAYKPIEVTKRKDFAIWGVVTYIVHRA